VSARAGKLFIVPSECVRMDKATIALLSLALLACVLGAAWLFSINEGLAAKLDALNRTSAQQLAQAQSDYLALNTRYVSAQKELSATSELLGTEEAKLASTSKQLSQAEAALNDSRQNLAGQQQKADALNKELNQLESSINESLAWFRDNAYMPVNYTWTADIFMTRVMSDCTDKGSLNLACVSHLMENTAFAIHYRTGGLPGNVNHFKGVKGTIDEGWGDCKDYSLLFKAILNSVRRQNASLSIVAWQPASSGDFRVYPKETPGETGPYWVYANAKGANMGAPQHAYVICYSVDAASGHCTVALSDADVQASQQVPLLVGAYAFEPQSGRYLGRLGESLSICTGSGCKQQGGKIWLVISDSDLYMYGDNGWQGYADYLSRVQEAKNGIPS